MKQFVEKLQEEVEPYLQKNDVQANVKLEKVKSGIFLLEDIFRKLKTFVVEEYEFKNEAEEIMVHPINA